MTTVTTMAIRPNVRGRTSVGPAPRRDREHRRYHHRVVRLPSSTAQSLASSSTRSTSPARTRWIGTLQAFGVYFIRFIVRPIGAAIFGHYGDRIGRKATLIVTLLMTGIATAAVALVPGLRLHRHLGRRHPHAAAADPGHRRRRRMGRLGAADDGVVADQQEPRLHLLMAAIRRARRPVPRQRRGAGHVVARFLRATSGEAAYGEVVWS